MGQQRRLVTVIIVDSKWNNDGAVLGHPSLRGLRHLHLEQSPSFSRIWRSNRLAVSGCVSSIEAIYCLVREVDRHLHPAEQRKLQVQEGEAPIDQLLLLFALTRHLIASRTGASELAPFEQARKDAALS